MEVQEIQEPPLARADYMSIRSLFVATGGNLGMSVESIRDFAGYKLVDLRASRLCAFLSPLAQAAETGLLPAAGRSRCPARERWKR